MCFAPQRRALFRHFFDIWTSKSGPSMWCFVHFDLEMCFAPQQRALFRHRNFQKWSEPGVFCTFWLGNVLRATTACTFSTSQLPKVVREWCVLYILTWKCASRHNGVQFFISHLASWLCTRRFSEPTFRPSRATNHWKNTVNRDFPTFSRICIFFLLIFSLLTLLTSAFQLSILSEVSLLNFLRLLLLIDIIDYNHNGYPLTIDIYYYYFAPGLLCLPHHRWKSWRLVDQGRAGQKGHAVTLIVERDAHALRGIVEARMGWCEGHPEKLLEGTVDGWDGWDGWYGLPSSKRLHNYGKSPFSMGKSTMTMAIFNSYVKLPEGKPTMLFFHM